MNVRLAIITTPFMDTDIQPEFLDMPDHVTLEIYPVEHVAEACTLLLALEVYYDGFFICDFILYHYLRYTLIDFKKPMRTWQASYAEYCDELLSAAFEHNLPRGPWICDFALLQGHTYIDALIGSPNLHRLFLQCEPFLNKRSKSEFMSGFHAIYPPSQNIRTDSVLVTSSSLLASAYKAKGIATRYISPTGTAISDMVKDYARSFDMQNASDGASGVATLAIYGQAGASQDPLIHVLSGLATKFVQSYQSDAQIHVRLNRIEVHMSKYTLYKLTYNKNACLLSDYLRKSFSKQCAIGYGVGENLIEARYAALCALYESQLSPDGYSYFAEGNTPVPTPLDKSGLLPITHDSWLGDKSLRSGVSTSLYRDLINIALQCEDHIFSARELAKKLKMPPRTVYRIIQRLEEAGDLDLQLEAPKQRGRPEKRYKISWL